MRRVTFLLAASLSATLAISTQAGAGQEMMKHGGHEAMMQNDGAMAAKVGDMAAMSDGMVKKVDTSRKRITIKHGPLANLNMPPMTMVFRVKDDAMLGMVKPGANVKFRAEDVGGALTVTEIKIAK